MIEGREVNSEYLLETKTIDYGNPILVPSLSRELFRKMVKKNGADHILFASDSPWCDQKETYEMVDCSLEEKDKNQVFYENALRLFDLSDFTECISD